MSKPDLLEDLLAMQYVFNDNRNENSKSCKPACQICGADMVYDKVNNIWTCVRCNL